MKLIYLNNSERRAIVDDEDYKKAMEFDWFLRGDGYVCRTTRPYLKLEQLVFGVPRGRKQIDHRNRNRLDARKRNLRFCTQSLNNANTGKYSNNRTGFRGVFFDPRYKSPYRAYISYKGKRTYLGNFDVPVDAAKAYDLKAKELFGEFANPNFPMRFSRRAK